MIRGKSSANNKKLVYSQLSWSQLIYSVLYIINCDRLQENRAQAPRRNFFFCTYTLLGEQILSSLSFIAVALAIPAIYHLTGPFVRHI